MSNSNIIEKQDETSGQIGIFIYRTPKKNHDAIMQLNKQSYDLFMNYGVSQFEVFSLNNRENMMEFVNIAKTISANQDEEIWLEIQSYRNAKHVQEVMAKMENDKSGETLYKQFMDLIVPGSIVSFGDFSRLEEIAK
ncbi:MAG: DUF1428 family protein [Nitrosopumilus sp.]|nr:DUF1428 family protein [Nitrosopumilus sp.]